MKLTKYVLMVAVSTIMFTSCKQQNAEENKAPEVAVAEKAPVNPENIAKAEFNIDGMTCAIGCAGTIQKNLAKVEGVQSAKVDFDKQLAMVTYDKSTVNFDDLENAVSGTAAMYKVSDMKNVEDFGVEKKD